MSNVPRTLQRVVVKNGDLFAVTLCIEPWATEYSMPQDAEWVLEIEGPAYPEAIIMIQREADRIVAFGWDGSDFRILDSDGAVIQDWMGVRVPDFRELERQRSRKDS